MNSHWTRPQITSYLRSPRALTDLRAILIAWLAGDRADFYQHDIEDITSRSSAYIELGAAGMGRTGRLHCSEISSPDGCDFLPLFIAPALDEVSDLGGALAWVAKATGCLVMSPEQRLTLHQPTPQLIAQPYHSKFVTQRIPGASAADRLAAAPGVIAECWHRAYERMRVRFEPAWADKDNGEAAVELALAAKALRDANVPA